MNNLTVPTHGDYVTVGGINVWWQASDPDRIHYVTNDATFTDTNGEHPGIRVVFSSNPRSADYSPANFNRCARALRTEGKSAPAEDVPERSRRLRDRFLDALTLRESYLD